MEFCLIPFNQSVDKTDFLVKYNGYYYSWTQATSPANGPIIDPSVFGWDRNQQMYIFISDILEPGYGCWMYAYEPCELWIENISITPGDYITELEAGWNIFGVPYNQSVNKIDLLVNDTSWDDAVSAGIINDYVFGWDRSGQSYSFADTFEPGYAYWVYAYQQCKLKRAAT